VLSWQLGEVAELIQETPRVASLVLKMPDWPGHLAGQHVDVRVTAEDGYQAERSYSIASAPDGTRVALTVQRLDDGEVSPYLTDEPGFWETNSYHNYGDPWQEQRYSGD